MYWKNNAALLLILIIYALWWEVSPSRRVDPDPWYHKALSREMVRESSILKQLPQVEDLGWGFYFPEKEFLFHIYTAGIYKVFGEEAIARAVSIIGMLAIVALYYTLLHFVSVTPACAILGISIFLNPSFLYRITMLRPHVFAVCFFVCILYAFILQKKYLVLLASALFSLSYHAFYIPGVFFFLFYIYSFWKEPSEHKEYRICSIFGVIGLLIGIIINPYFPSNIIMSITHANIAITSSSTLLYLGRELIPDSFSTYIRKFGFYFFLLITYGIFLIKSKMKKTDKKYYSAWIILCAIFWGLTKINPRAIEYAAPITAIVFALIAKNISKSKFYFPIIFLFFLHTQTVYSSYLKIFRQEEKDTRYYSIQSALNNIPEPGKKIFHCSWDISPYILYHRPDLKFIDILDPTFLYQASPQLGLLRDKISRGEIADPYIYLRQQFHADYVLCEFPSLNKILSKDLRYQLIFSENNGFYLWKITF